MKTSDYAILAFLLWLLFRKSPEVTASVGMVDDQTGAGLGPGQWRTLEDGSSVWYPASTATPNDWPPCGC